MTPPDPAREETATPPWARRYLRIFVAIVLVSAVIVVTVNLVAYSLMMRPNYVGIAQLRSGWARTYKPMIQDRLKPATVVFGASWARDAFDPDDLTRITGRTAVNHAISLGHPYECRRFLQSAIAGNPDLKTVILNVDSFLLRPSAVRFEYGFDESILNVDDRGAANPFVALHRAYARTLSGAAVGSNLELFQTLLRLRSGATKEELVPSYERRDWSRMPPVPARNALTQAQIDEAQARAANPPDPRTFAELAVALDAVRERGMAVNLYFTPFMIGGGASNVATKLATLSFVSEHARKVTSRLTLYDFDYPNAVTMECLTNRGLSQFYRPDGHPRPTVGVLMASRMFDKPFPAWVTPEVQADFGVDLLSHPEPALLIAAHARRQVELMAPAH